MVSPAPRVTFAQEQRVRRMLARPTDVPAAKNIPLVLELPGPVDGGALELSLRQLVERHPVLHHRLAERGGEIVFERVGPTLPPPPCVTWPAPGTGRRPGSDSAEALVRGQADQPFGMTSWPLFRAGLIERPRPLLCLVFDHLVCDGWSLSVIARDLEALYLSAKGDRQADLPAADDFVAFAEGERARFSSSSRVARAVDGLRAVLDGRPLEPGLPLAAGPWDLSAGRYRQLDVLTGEEAAAFERRCRDGRATAFMGVVAAVAVTLHETTGVDEAAMLLAVHNRDSRASATGVGWYANMLPLYIPVRRGQPLDATLRATQSAMMAILQFYDVPLARLKAAGGGSANVGANWQAGPAPLFVSFSDDRGAGHGPPTTWRPVPAAPSYRAGYGLWLSRHAGGLRLLTASPRPTSRGDQLEAFESALCAVIQGMAAG